jgi:sterol desaturase/sphingolipid hydroxylase (fatty acid hydroxylase superfamily)
VYQYVHKHHHRQGAPSRGNHDAINVHPLEFGLGEYMQLGALAAIPQLHVWTAAAFVVCNGLLSTLSHTRHDLDFKWLYGTVDHQTHHNLLTCNYGQYIMLWDSLMGTYRHRDTLDTLAKARKGE